MSLNDQLKFWEQVYKYSKHSVKKKKAKEMVVFLSDIKTELDAFDRFCRNAVNVITKSTLEK